ncbi:MAG: peptide deformylase [Nakamurella sp.]
MTTHADRVDRLLAGPRPLPIVPAGLPVLRHPADRYDGQLDDEVLTALVEAMRETMHAAPGVGLAAPQIGVGLQIAVLEDPAAVTADIAVARDRQPLDFLVLINPRYTPVGDTRTFFYEGCLSVPGFQAAVDRPAAVHLTAAAADGSAIDSQYHGWQARIVAHETDHLAGMLYLDRADLRSLAENSLYQALWAGPSIEPARKGLGF